MIRTRVPENKLCPFSKRWWDSDLSCQKAELKKLSQSVYKFRVLLGHFLHTELRKAWNAYGEAIIKAKWQHWEDFLENMAEHDLWTANNYFKEPMGNGGKSCIPTLKVPMEGTEGLLREVNTNDGKAMVRNLMHAK